MTGKSFIQILFLILLFTGVQNVYGNDVEITSVVNSQKISLDDQLVLTVTVSGSGLGRTGDPELAPMPDFRISRPSTENSYNIENGKMSFFKKYTYVLFPKKTGVFDVGEVSLKSGGKTITARATKVEVVKGSAPQTQTAPKTKAAPGTQPSQVKGNTNIFINTFVDKKEPYAGEQITFTFELYHRIRISETEYEPPSTTGFWLTDLPQIPKATKTVRGNTYYYNVIKSALFPTTSGELTIGSASLDFRTGFFSFGETYTIKSDPIIIKAKPLPEKGKPDDFGGAVGNFSISSEADNTTVKAGDVVTIRVSVTGQGNIDLITSITEPDFSSFKTYDPKVSEKISNSGFVVGGVKTWEYVIIPKQQGDVTIEPFALSYFNPEDKDYHTVSTKPIELKVVPGDAVAFNEISGSGGGNSIIKIASDIRYIKPDKTLLVSIRKHWYLSIYFYLLYILPLAGFITTVIVKKRQDEIERNTGLKRKLKAWKHAHKRIEEASKMLEQGNIKSFCGKLHESITCYIADMLNIDTGTLTSADLEKIMIDNGINTELAERVRKTMEMCDFVRFASIGTGRDAHENILRDTRDLISKLREML